MLQFKFSQAYPVQQNDEECCFNLCSSIPPQSFCFSKSMLSVTLRVVSFSKLVPKIGPSKHLVCYQCQTEGKIDLMCLASYLSIVIPNRIAFFIAVKYLLTHNECGSHVAIDSLWHNYQQNNPCHAVGHSCLSTTPSNKACDLLLDLLASALRYRNNFNHEKTHAQLILSS